MRPIKFRVWDKIENDMIEWILPLSDWTFLLEDANGLNYVSQYPWMDTTPPDNFVIMQYTWFIDSYKHEIYEWDLIKTIIRDSQYWMGETIEEKIFEVIFSDYYAGFYPFCIPETPQKHRGTVWNWEIVGNIFQNPELLNKK